MSCWTRTTSADGTISASRVFGHIGHRRHYNAGQLALPGALRSLQGGHGLWSRARTTALPTCRYSLSHNVMSGRQFRICAIGESTPSFSLPHPFPQQLLPPRPPAPPPASGSAPCRSLREYVSYTVLNSSQPRTQQQIAGQPRTQQQTADNHVLNNKQQPVAVLYSSQSPTQQQPALRRRQQL